MFNSIGSSSNFAQAGKSAADETVRAFAASRRNAPKYDEMAIKARELRSKEKIAVMKAESAVAQAGIQAKTDVKTNQIKVDSELDYKMAKRKAGVLATAGQMFSEAGGMYWDSKDRESMMRDTSDSNYESPHLGSAQAELEEAQAAQTQIEQGINPETGKGYGASNSPSPTPTPATAPTPSPSASSTPTPTPAPAAVSSSNQKGSTAMRLMSDLTSNGYTPVQAAAIVGNAQHESANFTAHEEFAPNAYGTKGAGFFQWTNAGGSNRRDSFESHARSKGLKPQSYEANTSYMMHELKGGAGNHWTGGMNDQSFRQINDLNTAVVSFQDNYLRPSRQYAHTDARLSYAQQALSNWNSRNS